MNQTQRYQLIDGTFSAADARHVLLALVKSKIDFHSLEKHSNEERFGCDRTHSEHRLKELRQLHETLREVCRVAVENGERIRVNGWLEIESIPADQPPA